jgi:3-isopropylmalate dehydratase small subunit
MNDFYLCTNRELKSQVCAKLDIQNIDTDMIIPKQFLKTIKRSGLGQFAFNDLRYDQNGEERKDFILNSPNYRKSSIIIAGDNFGCGSSRVFFISDIIRA